MQTINSLKPRQNGRHFADDIFKLIFLNENVSISIKISLKFIPRGPIHNIPALVQIMAWRRLGDKPLSEPMMVRLPTHICVTRPQWVKPSAGFSRGLTTRWIYMAIVFLMIYRDANQHYSDVTMSAMGSQINGVSIVYWIVCSGANQTKHQSSASLAFVWEIHRWPVNTARKGSVTRKMFPSDGVIMMHTEACITR